MGLEPLLLCRIFILAWGIFKRKEKACTGTVHVTVRVTTARFRRFKNKILPSQLPIRPRELFRPSLVHHVAQRVHVAHACAKAFTMY